MSYLHVKNQMHDNAGEDENTVERQRHQKQIEVLVVPLANAVADLECSQFYIIICISP